jgi:sodium transport system permease protein
MPRWSVVRLIANREVRDQLRDKRTMFLILALPLLMYPLFIGVGILYVSAMKKQLIVAVVGAEHLPKPRPAIVPEAPGAIAGVPAGYAQQQTRMFSPLIIDGKFVSRSLTSDMEGGALTEKEQDAVNEEILTRREADAILVIDPDFTAKLEHNERPVLRILGRDGEENSKLAIRRLTDILRDWADGLKAVRFARAGLPANFDSPVEIKDPQSDKPPQKKALDEVRDQLVKLVPFLLVMWMLTGAIYPAIDMTAGEKERGTMETLLISPAERSEIVFGKFIAVVVMGFGTAVWNVLLLMVAVGIAPLLSHGLAGYSLLSVSGLAVCLLAALPLAMLLAACTLSLGVFARSTKEGNYYMVPMFFVILPVSYWSMTPGMELDSVTSWVPVANALLLQQRLMAVRTDPFPWQHVPAVVISLSLCIGLALWAAVKQFQRESVLFREAETARRGWSLFGKK